MIGGERQLFLRILSRTVAYSSCVFVPGVVVAGAYHHRPLPDLSNGNWGGPSHYTPKPVTKEQKRIRKKPFFSREAKTENEINDQSPESPGTANKSIGLPELFDATIDTGYTVSRFLVINIVNLVINMGMKSNLYNSFRTLKDERYEYLLSSIFSRDENEALITISNHCSTIDDPVLLGGILPASSVASTQFSEKFRWCLCSQEICFKNPIKSSFFGAGKVLPIQRGGGISQPLLHNFALKIALKQWVHIFPEGKIVQSGSLGAKYFGTRSEQEAKRIGRLKWGVGKLIAHSPVPMRIIPLHHVGMEGIVPQKKTGETLYKV